jgi:hypothetical protein
VEDVVAWLLVAAGLLLVVLAGAAARDVHRDGLERARVQDAQRHQVSAVLIAGSDGMPGRYESRIARWTGPDEQQRIGRVPVPGVWGRPGDRVDVWIDATGAPTRPPATASEAVQAAGVTAGAVLTAGLVLLSAAWLGLRAVTTRCNDARWEREWARVGPLWSRRVP